MPGRDVALASLEEDGVRRETQCRRACSRVRRIDQGYLNNEGVAAPRLEPPFLGTLTAG